MKHLTQSEYQSLPVNEQSNWKEQYQSKRKYEDSQWYDIEENDKDLLSEYGQSFRLIYIPINPESVLNAEIDTTTFDRLPLNEKAERYASWHTIYNSNEWPIAKGAFIAGHSQGKKDHHKAVIDIVEAEIKYFNSATCFDSAGVLTDLLTKLKEIK